MTSRKERRGRAESLSWFCSAIGVVLVSALPAWAQSAADPADAPAPINLRMNDELPEAAKPAPAAPGKVGADAAAAPKAPDGKVKVIYLPESERQRIREELRAEILETARRENWTQPEPLPDWVRRLHPSGDLMVRLERDLYDSSNSNQFFNFFAINNGAPVNVTPPAPGQPITIPTLNTTQDRTVPRFQARAGLSADIASGVTAVLRLETGSGSNPVSPSQTLGSDFNRVNFLIDRAYLRFQLSQGASASLGRLPNPFRTYSELVWDRDLSFDGLALGYKYAPGGSFDIGVSGGAFSVENTDPNYPSSSILKVASYDKWLFGGQITAAWRASNALTIQPAIAYYDFTHLAGRLSAPCYAPTAAVSCNTDGSRPLFVQKGNTLFALRDLVLNNPGDPEYQYFGLASPFRIAHLQLSADLALTGPLHLALDTEFARNLAFNSGKINARQPVNNLGKCAVTAQTSCQQSFEGGGSAYLVQFRVGHPVVERRWQWQGTVGYRHVESDAVVDAYDDSDFFLGGTNVRGPFVSGVVGVANNTFVRLRYYSGSQLSSQSLSIDVLQFDVGVRF